MPVTIICAGCGKSKVISPFAANVQGQKYCSPECARNNRIYSRKADAKVWRVTVPLTQSLRIQIDQRAEMEGVTYSDLLRRYIVEGLER